MTSKRLLEIIPGFITWNVLLFLIWGSYFFPEATAYFILAFNVLWVYKGIGLAISAIVSHFRIKASQKLDWLAEAKGFGTDWHKVKHVVLILIANEPKITPEKTVAALASQTLPTKQIAVVLAADSWSKTALTYAEEIKSQYADKFGAFIVTNHPNNIPGEIKGKSSNEAWAAREAKKILVDKQGWDIKYMTITSNDSDAILDRQYFACLTYKFLDNPHRYEVFWQPAVVFYNNIWNLPAITRVVNTISTVWQMSLLSRKDRLVSFSNYSASLAMIDKIDYWDTDVIPEDYRIFFKAFFKLEGRVEVDPIFLPSSADAAESTSWWKTLNNDYQQKKRWAWGVSDLPIFWLAYFSQRNSSFINKTIRIIRVTADHLLWPISWFMITIGGYVSTFVNPNFGRTTIGYILPEVSSQLMSIMLFFLFILIIIDLQHRPPRPNHIPRWKSWLMPLEFLLMPIAGFFFGALPGLDAHTRLMLGKYIEYRVTEKV